MTPDKLLDALRELGAAVDSETQGHTNWGGCGVYAYHVHRRLHAIGVPSVPVLLSYGNFLRTLRLSYGRTSEAVRSGDASPAHVVVRIRLAGQTWWHDSENTEPVMPEAWHWQRAGVVPTAELQRLVRSPYGWNPRGFHITKDAGVAQLARKHLPSRWRGKFAA